MKKANYLNNSRKDLWSDDTMSNRALLFVRQSSEGSLSTECVDNRKKTEREPLSALHSSLQVLCDGSPLPSPNHARVARDRELELFTLRTADLHNPSSRFEVERRRSADVESPA